jgi:pimeloyl-ACP methyl ester carboxylesterase
VIGLVAFACATTWAGTASAEYRVDFTALKIISSLEPDVAPSGANNWACKPGAAHPYPVILVHGLFANQHDTWYTLAPLLANNGYCVFTLNYGGHLPFPVSYAYGISQMQDSAEELSAFVDRVRAATGAAKVDIVGHSLGATMPHYYLEFLGGDTKVHDFVGLAGAVHGATAYGLAGIANAFGLISLAGLVVPVVPQLYPDSAFLRTLNAGVVRPGVRYTMIATRYDGLVTPSTSGFLPAAPNVKDITVQSVCPWDFANHIGMPFDPNALRLVLNALDPAHAKQSCRFVPTIF